MDERMEREKPEEKPYQVAVQYLNFLLSTYTFFYMRMYQMVKPLVYKMHTMFFMEFCII
jgi:hypothetical protein